MDRCLITVIVPVYNVEDYLIRCVKSIQAQTYQDIEILLIDDGSTDMSSKYCDELATQDDRIKVIHQNNAGLSCARNAGLDIAKGQWMSFIDSDDYIHPDMLKEMLFSAEKCQTEIVVCGVTKVDEEGSYISAYVPRPQILEGKALHRYFFEAGKGEGYICNKLYSVNLFQDIRFPEGKLYEDGFVLPQLLELSKKAVFIDKTGYYYTQRRTSITNTVIKKGMDIRRQLDSLEARQLKLRFMELNYPALVPKAKRELLEVCCWSLYKTYKAKGEYFKQNRELILKIVRQEKKGAENKGVMIFSAIRLITLSPWLFYKMYGAYDTIKSRQINKKIIGHAEKAGNNADKLLKE